MANPSKKKGTAWETELLKHLGIIWFSVKRAPLSGRNDRGDFTGTGELLVEAKAVEHPTFVGWAFDAIGKVGEGKPWLILWKGDRRRKHEPLAVMPAWLALRLLETDPDCGFWQREPGEL